MKQREVYLISTFEFFSKIKIFKREGISQFVSIGNGNIHLRRIKIISIFNIINRSMSPTLIFHQFLCFVIIFRLIPSSRVLSWLLFCELNTNDNHQTRIRLIDRKDIHQFDGAWPIKETIRVEPIRDRPFIVYFIVYLWVQSWTVFLSTS